MLATTLIQAFESDPQSVTRNDIQTHYNTLQKAFNDLAHNGSVVQLETLATMDLAEYDSSTTSAFIKLQEKAVEMLDDILANLDTVAEFVAKMETKTSKHGSIRSPRHLTRLSTQSPHLIRRVIHH
ncbi:hypothetical protein MGH68_08635 [Erysipelothrix sp. D19-032]